MIESVVQTTTTDIDEVVAGEAQYMATRDFVLDVVPDFLKSTNEDGPDVAASISIAVREGDDAPESNGLPLGNLMFDVLVDEVPVSGKRVAFKAPLHVLKHIADAVNEAHSLYMEGLNPEATKARKVVTGQLGIPERIARLMTDEEVLAMTVKYIFK